MSINPYGDDFYPERKPVQHKKGPSDEPNFKAWGMWTLFGMVAFILWPAVGFGAMIEILVLIPCLAIVFGKYQMIELHTLGLPRDPFK